MKARAIALVIIGITAASIGAVMLNRVLRRPVQSVEVDRNIYPSIGIDLSAHNGQVDFAAVADDGVDFAFLKVSEGATWRDSTFERNYRSATDAGLKVGAYHFFRFDVEGWRQSVNITGALGSRHLDLPVAIDVEEWGNPTDYTTEEVVSNLRSLVELLRQNGREPIIYTNKNGYYRFIRDRFDDVGLWICSFTTPAMSENSRWTLWQHSHEGRINGINGPVDINTFNEPAHGRFHTWISTFPALSKLSR